MLKRFGIFILKTIRILVLAFLGFVLILMAYAFIDNILSEDKDVQSDTGYPLAEDMTEQSRAIANNLIQSFKRTCEPAFGKYRKYLSFEPAYFTNPMPYRQDKYSWQYELVLIIKANNDIPIGYVAGHTISYYIGVGGQAGWLTQKKQGMDLCKLAGNEGSDSFVPF